MKESISLVARFPPSFFRRSFVTSRREMKRLYALDEDYSPGCVVGSSRDRKNISAPVCALESFMFSDQ